MENVSYFGMKLRELRDKAGLTQVELAAKAGLHRQAIANFELGIRDPQWQSVLALAAALGVSCQEFVGPMEPRGATPSDVEPAPRRRPGKKR